jgi:hypothetical protein
MRPQSTKARDAGLALVTRLNGWLVTGAIAVSGLLSLVAAHAFHGHSAGAATTSAARGSPASRPAPQPSTAGGSSSLQQPAQTPSAAPAAPSPAVSGGS